MKINYEIAFITKSVVTPIRIISHWASSVLCLTNKVIDLVTKIFNRVSEKLIKENRFEEKSNYLVIGNFIPH